MISLDGAPRKQFCILRQNIDKLLALVNFFNYQYHPVSTVHASDPAAFFSEVTFCSI